MAPWPLIVAFVADLIMAWMLAGVIGHLGDVTIKNGVISAAFIWFGFVLTTLVVNNTFGMRSPKLTVIDGGHWLARLAADGRDHRRLGDLKALAVPTKVGSFRALSRRRRRRIMGQ